MHFPSRHIIPRRFAIATVAALGLAGCGGSGSGGGGGGGGGTTTAGGSNSLIAMSRCMRTHGVPNFPDPTVSSGAEGLSVSITPGTGTVTVAGIAFSGPAFTAAEKTCHFGPGSAPPITEAQQQGMIKNAHCIRTHGVPNFPDPTFGPNGKGVGISSGSQANRHSPAFQAAAKECRNVGTPIPGAG